MEKLDKIYEEIDELKKEGYNDEQIITMLLFSTPEEIKEQREKDLNNKCIEILKSWLKF